MKYLSIKYWLQLWLWTTPFFNNLLQNVNTKSIYNKNIFKLDCITDQSNEKITTCVHEAGHTIIALSSKFKNKFKKMEFFPNNKNYYGQTTFDELLPLTSLPSITNNELITLLHIDLGGFAAESIIFKTNFLHTKVIDSSDLQDYYNIYQKEFEIRKLKSKNENNLNFIDKKMNETITIINNKIN